MNGSKERSIYIFPLYLYFEEKERRNWSECKRKKPKEGKHLSFISELLQRRIFLIELSKKKAHLKVLRESNTVLRNKTKEINETLTKILSE